MQLSEVLERHSRATNPNAAWGYSPDPIAEIQTDGTIKVTTYHFEGEWKERICKTPEEVDFYLYADSGAVGASSGGKHFKAALVLEETGFNTHYTIDDKVVSLEEYKEAYPKAMQDDGEWLPGYWDGPGEWDQIE